MKTIANLQEGNVLSTTAIIKLVNGKINIHLVGYEDKIILNEMPSKAKIEDIPHIEMVVEEL
jgi:hypothetical protein